MRRRGFTLTEVLITLGIVGIVASLTAPSLVSQTQNKINGSKLAATVSLLESAFHNAISTEGVENLYQTRMWENAPVCIGSNDCNSSEDDVKKFAGELGRYLAINSYRATYPLQPYLDAGLSGVYEMNNNFGKGRLLTLTYPDAQGRNGFPFFLKNGSIVTIDTYMNASPTEAQIRDLASRGTSYYTEAANIFIDVNGIDSPNIVGRDIFAFYVGENGTLYPIGGSDIAVVEPEGGAWHGNGGYACVTENTGTWYSENGSVSDSSAHGYGCTGRVIDNGYKIDY